MVFLYQPVQQFLCLNTILESVRLPKGRPLYVSNAVVPNIMIGCSFCFQDAGVPEYVKLRD